MVGNPASSGSGPNSVKADVDKTPSARLDRADRDSRNIQSRATYEHAWSARVLIAWSQRQQRGRVVPVAFERRETAFSAAADGGKRTQQVCLAADGAWLSGGEANRRTKRRKWRGMTMRLQRSLPCVEGVVHLNIRAHSVFEETTRRLGLHRQSSR
jgi:hypothetical protein